MVYIILRLQFLLFTFVLVSSSYAQTQNVPDKCNRYFSTYEAKHNMPRNILKAISLTESGKWNKHTGGNVVWPWTVNAGKAGQHYDSKAEAIKVVQELKAGGRESIDVGCMQVNLKYHPSAFANLNEAFEPRHNIEYAAQFLKNHYKRTKDWNLAIGRYHHRDPSVHAHYVNKVRRFWKEENEKFNIASINDKPALDIKVKPNPTKYDNSILDLTKSALQVFGQ